MVEEPQAQDPGKSYQYMSTETPKLINWPKVIFIGIGIGLLVGVFFFLIWNPLSSSLPNGNDFLPQAQNRSGGNSQGTTGEFNPNDYICTDDLYNCDSFTSQSEAQYVFDLCKERGYGDIHRLDNDGDGVVCEILAL